MTSAPSRAPGRLAGLYRFAGAITLLTILGHTVLGFEQSLLSPIVGLAAAYSTELLLEWCEAWLHHRPPRFVGGIRSLADSLVSPHISGLACAMLLYPNEHLTPIAFAASAAIASKSVFRVTTDKGSMHCFNPSNFGISLTLLLFGWVSIAPPYHFTENLTAARIGLPLVIIGTGSFLNARFTKRMPVILGWVSAFVAQAWARSVLHDTPVAAALLPMTGVAFILFTFYMVTDPATTPTGRPAQLAFGAATGLVYGALVWSHVVFGLFFSLGLVCAVRGAYLTVRAWAIGRARDPNVVLRGSASPALPLGGSPASAAGLGVGATQ